MSDKKLQLYILAKMDQALFIVPYTHCGSLVTAIIVQNKDCWFIGNNSLYLVLFDTRMVYSQ